MNETPEKPALSGKEGWGDAVLEETPLPFCVLDASAKVLFCNDAFREFFLRSFSNPSEFPFDLFRNGSELVRKDVSACLQKRRPAKMTGLSCLTGGENKRFSLLINPLAAQETTPAAASVVCVEDGLFRNQTAFSGLGDGFEDIQRFLETFIHEFKNPLTVLKGSLQMLSRKFPENTQEHRFSRVSLDELSRINHLLDGLASFEFARDTELERLNLHRILDEMILFQSQSGLGNPFVKIYDPSLPEIFSHPYLLRQVILNLLKNAQSACTRGETIVVSTGFVLNWELPLELRPFGKKYAFADVIDHGPGIPEEIREKLFKPFFTTRKNGTGLGLSVSRQIMTRLKGELELKEMPNAATRFRAYFPLEPA